MVFTLTFIAARAVRKDHVNPTIEATLALRDRISHDELRCAESSVYPPNLVLRGRSVTDIRRPRRGVGQPNESIPYCQRALNADFVLKCGLSPRISVRVPYQENGPKGTAAWPEALHYKLGDMSYLLLLSWRECSDGVLIPGKTSQDMA
jgi:hypothetical protein